MSSLTGTWRLVRLAFRRDRIKLPAWIIAITAFLAANIPAVISIYGDSAADRLTYAVSSGASVIGRLFNGPLGSTDVGEIVTNETFMFTAVLVAFMSTLAVIRHTRQNEETGRSELIGSAVVGRNASLVAALLVTATANVILGALVSITLISQELPVSGSLGFGAALTGTGFFFMAVAAITAQISESARGANSMASSIIGIAFVIRGIGDSIGQVVNNGTSVISAWPTWLSPLGWGRLIYPYTDQRWWIFGLFAGAFILGVGIAFYLTSKRDIGLGIFPARRGPAHARQSLLSAFGLAWRLQRGILICWGVGIVIFGLSIGLIVKEFADMFKDTPALQDYLNALGGAGKYEDVFFSGMLAFTGMTIGGYAVQTLQRLRTEEAAGRLEPILATGVSKYRWVMSYVSCAFIGVLTLLALLGLSTSLTYVLNSGVSWSVVPDLLAASLVMAPAVFVLAGFAVTSFGLLPRATIAVAWSAFGFCLLISQFGELLKLPQLLINLSPFTHTPALPAEPISWAPLAILAGVATALTISGLAWFRRRDIANG